MESGCCRMAGSMEGKSSGGRVFVGRRGRGDDASLKLE
jgi:hypothetical protein